MPETEFPSQSDAQLVAWEACTAFERFIQRRSWDRVFQLVQSNAFLADLEAAARTPSSELPSMTPLAAIERALEIAIELGNIPVVAALMLARADWGGRPIDLSPLEALRANKLFRSEQFGSEIPERAILWNLILAWEYAAIGLVDDTRKTLTKDILKKEPSELSPVLGRRAVSLLIAPFFVDEDIAKQLVATLLADNYRVTLCQRMTAQKLYNYALLVAQTIHDPKDRIAELTAIIDKQAMNEVAPDTTNMLMSVVGEVESWDGDKDQAIALGRIAGSMTRAHETKSAQQIFLKAIRVAGRIADEDARADALQIIAGMQLRCGLIELAEHTAGHMTESDTPRRNHDRWETLEAVAAAYARTSQYEAASRVLRRIGPGYADYDRAVRRLAMLLPLAYWDSITDMANNAYTHEPQKLENALAAIKQEKVPRKGYAPREFDSQRHWLPGDVQLVIDNFASVRDSSPSQLSEDLFSTLLTEDEERRARQLVEAFISDDVSAAAKKRTLRQGSGQLASADFLTEGRTTNVFDAFRASIDDLYVMESQPAYESDRLWNDADKAASEGRDAEARTLYAEALQRDQFENLRSADPHNGSSHSKYEADFEWLRLLTLAAIAIGKARTGDPEIGAEIVDQAAEALAGTAGPRSSLLHLAFARADLAVGRTDSAFRRALPHLAEDPEAPALVLACGVRAAQANPRRIKKFMEETARLLVKRGIARRQEEIALDVAYGLIEMDALDAARPLAALTSGTIEGAEIEALLAEGLARRGDLDAAEAAATTIENYPARAEAFRRIAEQACQQGERDRACTAFEKAVTTAKKAFPRVVPRVLLDIAVSALRQGFSDTADDCVHEAVRIIRDNNTLDPDDLTFAAELQAMNGHPGEARQIADSINHVWLGPRCQYIVGLRLGSLLGEEQFVSATHKIQNEWWKSAAVATVMICEKLHYDSQIAVDVDELVSRIPPKGDARSRLQELIGKTAIRTKQFDIALSCVEALREDSDMRLVRLGRCLQEAGPDVDTLSFMAKFAGSACTSLLACVMLAMTFPEEADAIAREVLKYQPSTSDALPRTA